MGECVEELMALLREQVEGELLLKLTASKPREKEGVLRVTVQPFLSGGKRLYQLAYQGEKQVTHRNLSAAELLEELPGLAARYGQLSFRTGKVQYQALCGRDGRVALRRSQSDKTAEPVQGHNRRKQYLLREGTAYPFLVALDIMTAEGKVKAQRYHKFVQINKYLEIVTDGVKKLPQKELTIVDFGCGKAYLTFALYYTLHELMGREVQLVGVDLKEEVIRSCETLARDLGYEGMHFVKGDIRDYVRQGGADLVVSLHACDTATDEALIKAVEWNSKLIISVPCCQHELFSKLKNDVMKPIQQYGILNDKLTELVTDAIRALALEIKGYSVDVMEFLPLEHTMKNVLIRARRTGRKKEEAIRRYLEFTRFWQVEPYLQKLIQPELDAYLAR